VRELKRRAYAPFALISEEDFDREVARLDGEIPDLTDTQIIVAMMRLTAHMDDGHAGIRTPDGDNGLSRLVQLEFFLFAEGLFVTAAGPATPACWAPGWSRSAAARSRRPWRCSARSSPGITTSRSPWRSLVSCGRPRSCTASGSPAT
jgi:hypothetical protein